MRKINQITEGWAKLCHTRTFIARAYLNPSLITFWWNLASLQCRANGINFNLKHCNIKQRMNNQSFQWEKNHSFLKHFTGRKKFKGGGVFKLMRPCDSFTTWPRRGKRGLNQSRSNQKKTNLGCKGVNYTLFVITPSQQQLKWKVGIDTKRTLYHHHPLTHQHHHKL